MRSVGVDVLVQSVVDNEGNNGDAGHGAEDHIVNGAQIAEGAPLLRVEALARHTITVALSC